MKLAIKKTYCSNCRKLVKGKEQTDQGIRILCPKCGGVIWAREGLYWKNVRERVS